MYVIVAGAGIIGQEITKVLTESKHDVVVIDKDPDVCESIYAETGALTINGNATDIHTLEKAGASKADVVLCLMHQSADNIACALLARSLGIPRIVSRLRNPRYEEAYILAGVTSIVRMADLLVNQIIMEIEQPKVRKIMTLGGGKAEIYAVKIPESAKIAGMTIKEVAQKKNFPSECLFVGLYKEEKGEFLIPRGSHVVDEGDMVFLLSKGKFIKKATDLVTKV
ncbi:potassium transporter TrkA [candidate division WOR_3 bacterium SM23_42]|uniref:Trk system potassium uptake protein TrkA n=1 Tax=candidate division WOR_3 bacterium SM23_42 TaxID=1703779 RepID=A0A0S8FQ17_UNCW3|nr:MAG: potassium transporter TrkA [candidate division WOR_3 bacterium SM23_42]